MTRAIGLDFGTTNSALAIAGSDGSVRLAQFNGGATFRSILYFEEDDDRRPGGLRVVAGPDAIQSYLAGGTRGRLIQSMKSYLASRLFTQTQIFSGIYTLEEMIGILLRYLRRSAEAQLGDLGSSLIVGRPVHFSGANDEADDEFAVARLRAAFANAGFTELTFLPEPIAAAFKYQQRLDHDELVLIADFGGGTSDFSLVKLGANPSAGRKGQSSVIGTDGVGLAGDTFDSKLVRSLVAPMLGLGSKYRSQFGKLLAVPNWLYSHLERWHYLSFLKTRKNMELLRQIHFHALEPGKIAALIDLVDHDLGYRLYRSVEQTKCELSVQSRTNFRFEESAIVIQEFIERVDFERWIEPEVCEIGRYVDRLLGSCNVAPRDVDAIFMTGGSSFVPAIRRLFAERFGSKTPIRAGQEFTSVAEGLALHALDLV
ncbi:MAG TPA: Hsp70 family protein [Candidatus Binatia bacterium]